MLSNVVKKPMEQIFYEFAGKDQSQESEGSGDVKYHLGYSTNEPAGKSNNKVHITLLANPSHLEAVNPVVRHRVFVCERKRRAGR